MTDSRYLLTESGLVILSSQNPKAWTVSWPKSISLDFQVKASNKNKDMPEMLLESTDFDMWDWECTLGGGCCSPAIRRLSLWGVVFLSDCLAVFPAARGNHFPVSSSSMPFEDEERLGQAKIMVGFR